MGSPNPCVIYCSRPRPRPSHKFRWIVLVLCFDNPGPLLISSGLGRPWPCALVGPWSWSLSGSFDRALALSLRHPSIQVASSFATRVVVGLAYVPLARRCASPSDSSWPASSSSTARPILRVAVSPLLALSSGLASSCVPSVPSSPLPFYWLGVHLRSPWKCPLGLRCAAFLAMRAWLRFCQNDLSFLLKKNMGPQGTVTCSLKWEHGRVCPTGLLTLPCSVLEKGAVHSVGGGFMG